MGGISPARLGAVRTLIEQAPDNVVKRLDTALQGGFDQRMAEVHEVVAAEVTDRRVRTAVFAPLAPLCQPRGAPAILPSAAPRLLWKALKQDAPSSVAEAHRATLAQRRDDGPPPIYDELCRRAADGLQGGEPPWGEAAAQLSQGGSLDRLVAGLQLAPLGRTVQPKLLGWVRSMDGSNAAAVRIAFKDAAQFDLDAAPIFMEMIYAQLGGEPWQILRIISAVMDRPSDRYMAASEVASFGERLLENLDGRIEAVRNFDADGGPTAATDLAESVQVAGIIIAEFEQWLDIAKDGPWGSRLVKAKKALASSVESLLRLAPQAAVDALPSHNGRTSGKTSRLLPDITRDLDPDAVRKGYGALTFLSESRSSAAHGGFASMRAKIIEDLDKQIDQYAEDLIGALHEGQGDKKRMAAIVSVAADFLGLVRDPKAAEIVRRRAAAA